MGIRREPWKFLDGFLGFKISYGIPFFHPESKEAPIPDRRCLTVANDSMCQLHHSKCRGRPIDLYYSFMGSILAVLVYNRFVKEYHVFFDIQKFVSPLKFEEQKLRSDKQRERPYKDMAISAFEITDRSVLVNGVADFVNIRSILSERHLRPLVFNYFMKKAVESMRDIPGPTLLVHFDDNGPWVITSYSSYQDPERLVKAGEGEIAAVLVLTRNAENPCWLITEDSDALYLSMKHHRLFKSFFYSGSGGRYIDVVKNCKVLGMLRVHHICQYFLLSGTDFVRGLFPERTRSKAIWDALDGTGRDISDFATFERVMTLVYRGKLKIKPGKPIPGFPDNTTLVSMHKRVLDNKEYWDRLQGFL
jgi:hypothetical protein